jgi:hypothetical protein
MISTMHHAVLTMPDISDISRQIVQKTEKELGRNVKDLTSRDEGFFPSATDNKPAVHFSIYLGNS